MAAEDQAGADLNRLEARTSHDQSAFASSYDNTFGTIKTHDEQIDHVLESIVQIDQLSVHEQVQIYSDVHQALQSRLTDLDE
ncbi:MAG: hypothetical protein ACRCTR_07475 [Actinomycetota bacterium]